MTNELLFIMSLRRQHKNKDQNKYGKIDRRKIIEAKEKIWQKLEMEEGEEMEDLQKKIKWQPYPQKRLERYLE